MQRKNFVATLEDAGHRALVQRFGHAHTKPYVVYLKISLNKRFRIDLPPDSVAIGLDMHMSELYVKVLVPPHPRELTVDRYFYAFSNDDYMLNPNLGYIDSAIIGGILYTLFEDDFYYGSPLHDGIQGREQVDSGGGNERSPTGFVHGEAPSSKGDSTSRAQTS
jgi:hypothetical protein